MQEHLSKLYLEDLSEGQRFISGTHALDQAQILQYSKQFDPQVFHTDAKLAESSFFQGLAASGWHTASITMRLLVESLPIAGGIVGAGCEINWPRATRPHDVLQVESEVISITPSRTKSDRGILRLESLTKNQEGHVLQHMLSKIVVHCKNIEL